MADTESARATPSRNLRLRTGRMAWALASHASPTRRGSSKKGKRDKS